MEALTLTTDFGHRDWYVAAMKGVVLSRVPAAPLADAWGVERGAAVEARLEGG